MTVSDSLLRQATTAGDATLQQLHNAAFSIFTVNIHDVSLHLLGAIFGAMSGVLPTSYGAGQIVQEIFRMYNLGLWAFIGLVVTYTTVVTVINTAQEGSIMGGQQKRHQAKRRMNSMLAFRGAVGILLLTPKHTGYSLVQVMAMWLLVQGVHIANATWNVVLDYFESGGSVTSTTVRTAEELRPVMDAANAILRSEICMLMLRHQSGKYRVQAQATLDALDRAPKPLSAAQGWEYLQSREVLNQSMRYQPDYYSNPQQVAFGGPTKDSQGVCGVYRWSAPADASEKYLEYQSVAVHQLVDTLLPTAQRIVDTSLSEPSKAIQYNALVSATTVSLPSCLSLSRSEIEAGNFCSEADALFSAAQEYLTIMEPARLSYATRGREDSDSNAFLAARKMGWAVAGVFHDQIGRSGNAKVTMRDQNFYLFEVAQKNHPPEVKQTSNKLQLKINKKLRQSFDDTLFYSLLLGLHSVNEKTGYRYQARQLSEAVYAGNKVSAGFDFKKASGDTSKEIRALYQRLVLLKNKAVSEIGGTEFAFSGMNFVLGRTRENMSVLINDIWSAWTEFAQTGMTARQPLENVRIFGFKLIIAATKFTQNVTNALFAELSTLATVSSVAAIALGTATMAIKTIGKPMRDWALAALMMGNIFAIVPYIIGQILVTIAAPMQYAAYSVPLLFAIALIALFFYLPLILAILVPIISVGVSLGVYVPLIPYLVFIFAVIGWLISVIEVMLAAPLVAFGVAHPEGHDYMGRAEHTLILIMSVLLRPVSMIIGLLAGMIMAFIILHLINGAYSIVFESALNGMSAAHYTGGTVLVAAIGMLLLYAYLVLSGMNYAYSMVYVLGDRLVRWIGGYPESSVAPGLLEQVKSQLSSNVTSVSAGAGGMAQAQSSGMRPDPGILALGGFFKGGKNNEE